MMAKHTLYNFLGSYNRAYKTKIIDKTDFKNFLNNLKELFLKLENIDNTNEELLKGLFKECILDNFKYTTLLNENRVDLTIKKNNKTQVIFEFKSPNNKNEMLQIENEDINKKALQEAIWYFYDQDSKEISYNIKNIVITDTQHFFFFNPKYFCNKDLEKICLDFRNSQVAYTNTKMLYEQIREKIIDKNINFDYAEFDLVLYKRKILDNSLNEKDIKQLKYFYKSLHPDFLLREFSPKDSNELNSKFYNELLYILGLKEEGKNQKKIISSDIKGTLRDNIVETFSCTKFDDIINLIIIWLNRLLFLKLFESQLIDFNNNDKKYEFLNFDKISDFSKLNRLFFNILGKPLTERGEHEIPYLNSSLFERSELEIKYGNIANLDNDTTLTLFKGSILSKVKNYPKNPLLLRYLLDFLGAYSFSSNISDNNDKKDIINSSVLGLIFEKLNGYKDGSFFTPAHITEYMAENSINNAVLQKYKNYKSEELCNSIDDLKDIISRDVNFSSREQRRLFYSELLINSLKICDPAVGSGHFLVSALNYMIALKSELGLLPIENRIEVQNDALIIYEKDGETQFEYKRNNLESLKIQKTIFNEKRKIIENCLFGVDINPNSVHICCLRLWIELLKNTYYLDNTDEMQILPNIDINIKCGNSLVSAYDVQVHHCALEKLDGRTAEAKNIKEYKRLVSLYKDANSKISKKELKEQIKLIKDKIFPIKQLNIFENVATKGVFETSMEWMIEFPELLDENGKFIGFDIIIANPPYGILNKKQNQKIAIEADSDFIDYIKNSFEYKPAINGMLNIYKFFILRSFKLLKDNGIFIQIFPLSFTCDSSFKTLRKYIFNNYSVSEIEAFPERDSSKRRVFEHAKVSVCIVKAINTKTKHQSFQLRKNDNKFVDYNIKSTTLNLEIIQNLNEDLTIPLANDFDILLLNKIQSFSMPLKTFAHCYTGEIDISINSKYITNNSKDSEMIKGAIIDRYIKKKEMSQGEIQFLNKEKYLAEIKVDKAEHHKFERIVMQGLTGVNEKYRLKMTIVPPEIFCANSVNYILFNKHNVNKKYILGLLNSSLLNYIFKISSTNSNVNGYEIDNLPITFAEEKDQKIIENLVNIILDEKAKSDCDDGLCNKINNEINKKLYKIYRLTDEEIKIIESK